MSNSIELVNQRTPILATDNGSVKKQQKKFSCLCNAKKAVGLIALVIAAVMIIFAAILASGHFGGGVVAFTAGGLTFCSMLFFGLAAYFLVPYSTKSKNINVFAEESGSK
jgi:hypothetical protein